MTFDYKNGEDYVCVLCGEEKHTAGPRPDKLCDGCWELQRRIKDRPDLATRILREMTEDEKEAFLINWFRQQSSGPPPSHFPMGCFDEVYNDLFGTYPTWYTWRRFYRDHSFVELKGAEGK